MRRKALPVTVLVAGVLLFLVSAAADSLGIGGAPGFGWKQIVGTVAGVVAAAVGLIWLQRS
jgi:hypothetical protein